ncbi:ABC transporter permease [Sporichthya sp.]|uniref:branched-chain amino acid ABC transporter permease n=1 Tax=Sporichthya sp. TaxID=65475 RepID=UPI0017E346CE|nr:ABC transporter permease [Sporichthya sp.]MBA3741358.1 ABC transporter permease [Sporichthya sp.]
MNEYAPFLIFGITTGCLYGISAMGLVLTYKISGLFNIGHGAVSAASAFVFYSLRQQADLPWQLAAVISIFILGPISGLILERLAVVLGPATTANKIVGTVGLLVAIRAVCELIYGSSALQFRSFLPQDTAFTLAGVALSYENLIFVGLGVGSAVVLTLLFTRTRLGTQMRGVVDDPNLLDMTGYAPTAVRRKAWMIGSTFASLSGVLFASNQGQLDINVLSLLVVQAFGAACFGLFRSVPLAFAGGIAVGVLQKLVGKWSGTHANLDGLDLNLPFIILFVVLLVVPRRKLVEIGRQVKPAPPPVSPFPAQVRALGYAALFVVALFGPTLAGTRLPSWNQGMTQVILFLSLGLLVRTSGQISLCHIAFAAIGAAGLGHALEHGVPWPLAVIVGGLVVVPIAALLAIPAIRLSGLYLGLATLGFGISVAQFAYGKSYMFPAGVLPTGRPQFWGMDNDKHYYYLLLGIVIAAIGVTVAVERSRLGRLLRAMADSPLALTTLGLDVNVSKVIIFCISGFLAGISGACFASLFGAVNQDSFNYVQSLILLAVLAISGRTTVLASVVASALMVVVPAYIGDADLNLALQISFGLAAIIAAGASQGGIGRFVGSEAAKRQDRLVGPASFRAREYLSQNGSGGSADVRPASHRELTGSR